jgi:hypothetical protein
MVDEHADRPGAVKAKAGEKARRFRRAIVQLGMTEHPARTVAERRCVGESLRCFSDKRGYGPGMLGCGVDHHVVSSGGGVRPGGAGQRELRLTQLATGH